MPLRTGEELTLESECFNITPLIPKNLDRSSLPSGPRPGATPGVITPKPEARPPEGAQKLVDARKRKWAVINDETSEPEAHNKAAESYEAAVSACMRAERFGSPCHHVNNGGDFRKLVVRW
jgi:hypothetical protein